MDLASFVSTLTNSAAAHLIQAYDGRVDATVYVLKLEHDCYYVGWTQYFDERQEQHRRGLGANWTRLHKPLILVETLCGSKSDEKRVTLDYIKRYGRDHVRGGPWTRTAPPSAACLSCKITHKKPGLRNFKQIDSEGFLVSDMDAKSPGAAAQSAGYRGYTDVYILDERSGTVFHYEITRVPVQPGSFLAMRGMSSSIKVRSIGRRVVPKRTR